VLPSAGVAIELTEYVCEPPRYVGCPKFGQGVERESSSICADGSDAAVACR
jgi:hypothetical protein